jgi:DNA repair protein RecN (Recombination protein N)
MLVCLRVSDFAIIDELEVVLEPGLNVVTGETGAGKSMLVHALELVLGAKPRPELLRAGAQAAEVDALFDLGGDPRARERLELAGLTSLGDELALRRVVPRSGSSRAYINGKLASAASLGELARGLVEVTSQHEHHTLADARTHLDVLDSFAALDGTRAKVRTAYEQWRTADAARAQHAERLLARDERLDVLRHQLEQFDALAPEPGELERLRAERERLRHAERLMQAAGNAEDALYARDRSLCAELAQLTRELDDAARVDATLSPLAERVAAAQNELEDAAAELGRYARAVALDPERLAQVEDRVEALDRLTRRHGGSLDAVLGWADSAREELDALEGAETHAAQLQADCERTLDEASKLATTLSRKRKAAAGRLGKVIAKELRSLDMGEARVVVEVERAGDGAAADGAGLGPTGIDRAELLLAPNPGEPPRPLRRIASGGELSRALLAVKRVLGGLGPSGLYVFDEVDAGIGGKTAAVVGRKLREVAQHHQVLCITHLAPIAVYADAHHHVSKETTRGRTRSSLRRLVDDDRVDEIARMLGGIGITDRTRETARELLRDAVHE